MNTFKVKYMLCAHQNVNSHYQQGATLIVGLIMLFLLTIIGMASMNVTTVDVKVTANAKDRQLAFIGAEARLFQAGQDLKSFPEMPDNTLPGYKATLHQSAGANWWEDTSKWNLAPVPGTLIASEYQIEFPEITPEGIDLGMCNAGVSSCKYNAHFPTTVRATGPGQSTVVLHSYYKKKLDKNPLQ